MKRRSAVVGAVAGVAALTGAGTALWRSRVATEAVSGGADDIWSQTFATTAGAPLALADLRGRPLLLNFWATWCVPCVVEMPLLDAFSTQHAAKGWRVLALAIDRREAVERFVAERSLTLPVALAAANGLDLARTLGNKIGALPFSAVFSSAGRLAAVHLGPVQGNLLTEWVQTVH